MASVFDVLNEPIVAEVLANVITVLTCYLCSTLLCEVNGRPIRRLRCAAHALLVAATMLATKEAAQELMRRLAPAMGTWEWAFGYTLYIFHNPLWLIACVLITIWVLRIPWSAIRQQVVIIFCAYQLPTCILFFMEMVFWSVLALMRVSYSPDNLVSRYFSLIDSSMSVLYMAVLLTIWLLLRGYIRRNRHLFKLLAENNVGSKTANLLSSAVQILLLWVIVMGYAMTSAATDYAVSIFIQMAFSIAIIAIHALVIFLHYYLRVRNQQSKYLQESNRMMIESIESFRSIKHDFANILHTYDGYFALEDYEGLRRYHEVLHGKTIMAGDRLSLQTAFADAPGVLGVLLNAMEKAEASGVSFDCMNVDLLTRMSMPMFDLCRMLGILLNNAIEHAAQTKVRTVAISTRTQANGKAVVIITNSVDGKINTADLFKDGYTTKEGHMGHGLAEVNRILADHYGCTILPNCTEVMFSMFVAMPLEPERTKTAAAESRPGMAV